MRAERVEVGSGAVRGGELKKSKIVADGPLDG